MNAEDTQITARTERIAGAYNQAISVFWAALAFLPLVYFWYLYQKPALLLGLQAVSLLSLALPRCFWRFIQLSDRPAVYHRVGIRLVRRLTQGGDWAHFLIRRHDPAYRVVRPALPIRKDLSKTYVNEKFHFAVFLFFLGSSVYALILREAGWAIVLALINVIFNVYPIWLQQYNRLRMNRVMHGRATKSAP